MKKVRVLLIEENRLLREALAARIGKQPDLEVAVASGEVEDILLSSRKYKPDVVLLDLSLRDQNRLRIVEGVRKETPTAKLIAMGIIPFQADILEPVRTGVSGFILKEATYKDCLKTIRTVAAGANVLPPELTDSLFSQIVDDIGKNRTVRWSDVRMTKREQEIVDLIAEGLSNKEIAQRLHIATFTVKSHVHNILDKLGLHNRVEIALQARAGGAL